MGKDLEGAKEIISQLAYIYPITNCCCFFCDEPMSNFGETQQYKRDGMPGHDESCLYMMAVLWHNGDYIKSFDFDIDMSFVDKIFGEDGSTSTNA